jgi:tripartite ATP-independent transporter DctP family solute receptor
VKRRISWVLMASLLIVGVLAGAVMAQEQIVIRLGYADPPQMDGPEHVFSLVFKNVAEATSGGRIKVELFPNGQLGTPLGMMEMVQAGTLEATIETGVAANFFPPFQVINIPYLFMSEDVAWEVMDSPFMAELIEEMAKVTGMRCLGISQNGTRHFTNNVREIRTPADLKGIKFRVMESPVYMKMLEAMGASGIPIAWPEVYTSLQTGVADGHENPVSIIEWSKMYEVQKYLTLDGHVWSEDALFINEDFWQSIPEDLQKVIIMAANQGKWAGRLTEQMKSMLTAVDALREYGMQIYTPTLEERAMFRDASQAPVVEWMKTQFDPKWVDGILEAVAEAEAKLGYR